LLYLHKLENSPIPSNCYVVIDEETGRCIVVDPGSYDDNQHLEEYITKNKFTIIFVVLTHEHFDHIAGIDKLYSKFPFELICTKETAIGISNSRRNLSFFNDLMLPVVINTTPSIVMDSCQLLFKNETLTFYHTPGHSPGSMCFIIDQYFFSGDTLLHAYNTRLNLPGSNKKQFAETLVKLKQIIEPGMIICPGHGNCFKYGHKILEQII
jgi:glyoxylase-like metal-dependent hydrolase (beta-lactamase superfamily II)